jgi:dihydrofolate reductase
MFGKKKQKPQIDKEQLELIQNAQKRIKQKKRLYIHFILFLIGVAILIITNVVLGLGDGYKLFGFEWIVSVILFWLLLIMYHAFNVFVIHKFMGSDWEKTQLEKLVSKQQIRIDKLKTQLKKEDIHVAKSDLYNEELNRENQELTIIVAAGENDAIGKDNKLIWHLSDDLKRFKNLTNNHHIIMGRKTFESFPKPLPNRTHIVITRQNNYQVPEGVIVVNSLEKAITIAKNDAQPFIIGGGEIYKQAMHLANKIELTRVHENFDADTFFPKVDTSIWKVIQSIFHDKDEKHKYDFSFLTYKRK